MEEGNLCPGSVKCLLGELKIVKMQSEEVQKSEGHVREGPGTRSRDKHWLSERGGVHRDNHPSSRDCGHHHTRKLVRQQ